MFVTFLSGCEHNDVTSRYYPRVKTLEVINISEELIRLNAEINFRGNFEIINYGFVWSVPRLPSLDDGNSDKLVFTDNITTKRFSAEIPVGSKKGLYYNVRAFVETKDYLVYGINVEFRFP